jgi:hypothetical protein
MDDMDTATSPTAFTRIRLFRATKAEVVEELLKTLELHRSAKESLGRYMDEHFRMAAFLEQKGYRRCDAPACNCNSWHQHNCNS